MDSIESLITVFNESPIWARLKQKLALALSASALLIALLLQPHTLSFLRDLSCFSVYTILAAALGLTIRITASNLGIRKPSEQAALQDEVVGRMLVRRGPLRTFARICSWNILVSFAVVAVGLVTFGFFPLIWVFLNLGVFSSSGNVFKRYLHPWVETAAVILSSSLGIWGGVRLDLLLNGVGTIQSSIVSVVLGLHVVSAMLETSEIYT